MEPALPSKEMESSVSQELVEKWITENPWKASKLVRKFVPPIAQRDTNSLVMETLRSMNSNYNFITLAKNIVDFATDLVSADLCHSFLVDRETHELVYLNLNLEKKYEGFRIPIRKGIIGMTAADGEVKRIANIKETSIYDARYDDFTGTNANGLLCLPIANHGFGASQELLGVIAFLSEDEFAKNDVNMLSDIVSILCILMKAEFRLLDLKKCESKISNLQKSVQSEKDHSDLLFSLASELSLNTEIDQIIDTILQTAKKQLWADSASLFLVDKEKKELYATRFDHGNSKKVSFPMNKGIAGSVATTGVTANYKDVYECPIFNREVDKQNNYRSQSLLCVALRGPDREILGVVNLVNKTNPQSKEILPFSMYDQRLFEEFSVFCGLAIHKSIMAAQNNLQRERLELLLEMMNFHNKLSPDVIEKFMSCRNLLRIESYKLSRWNFDPHVFADTDDTLAVIGYQMFSNLEFDKTFVIPDRKLVEYILTVRKNYRPVAYHNFTHAISVTHGLFILIVNGVLDDFFDRVEMFAMIVACINHDIDHRGMNNAFQQRAQSAFAHLYTSSTMERHHFNHSMTILNSGNDINVLSNLSKADYKKCLQLIEYCILATDLSLYFERKKKMEAIFSDGAKYDKTVLAQKELLQSLLMTCSDLAAMYKPWETTKHTADAVYEEFFLQGDEEKRLGMPYSSELTNRDNASDIPRMQVGFYNFVVIPAFDLLLKFIDHQIVKEFHSNILVNKSKWQELHDSKAKYEHKLLHSFARKPSTQ
ncbi:cGMP-specific 3',5'-cyclic phosphodiesterase [Boothiomyces sp. JEL0866]|nr:cGMP-specific 3',5'-cyclic phosphodiesterase [Boothiomyces sp. JEL0866]